MIPIIPPLAHIDEVMSVTAASFGLTVSDLKSQGRSRRIAHVRQVAMYLARHLTRFSQPYIGAKFGGRDHTTVLHACRAVSRRSADDPEIGKKVEEIVGTLARLVVDEHGKRLMPFELSQQIAASRSVGRFARTLAEKRVAAAALAAKQRKVLW